MTFGVLTTKHHDGFALWDSAYSEYDIANTPYQGGQGDVVREYVDAFRSRGLEPGLYFSIWDTTRGLGEGPITDEDMTHVKNQLSELLMNYGTIPLLIFDGWSWEMGHNAMPYDEIREHVKTLQPNCLLMDLTHLQNLWETDVVFYEEPKEVWAPPDNTIAASQGNNIVAGNGWFWGTQTPGSEPMSTQDIVVSHLQYLEPIWVTFILNCPPNQAGRLDDNIVNRLNEVGQAWSPDLSRSPLPPQDRHIERPVTPVGAQATSGDAFNAIDGINDTGYYSVWQSQSGLPQSITLDLGALYDDISMLDYVPKYNPSGPSNDGSITSYRISVSTDGSTFDEVAKGAWPGDSRMKVVTFTPVPARYVRLEAVEAVNNIAAATEITIGRAF